MPRRSSAPTKQEDYHTHDEQETQEKPLFVVLAFAWRKCLSFFFFALALAREKVFNFFASKSFRLSWKEEVKGEGFGLSGAGRIF